MANARISEDVARISIPLSVDMSFTDAVDVLSDASECSEEFFEDDLDENADIDYTDVVPLEFFQEYFAEMNDDDFVTTVTTIIEQYEHWLIENNIFIMYLNENEPQMLINLAEAKRKIAEIESKSPLLPTFFEMPEEIITADTMPFTLGYQINISQRSDLVARYVDELNTTSLTFHQKAAKLRKRYKAEIEESEIRSAESKDALYAFEMNIMIGAVDPITQRIPAEKFIQHMHEWLKLARFITEKIRLNISYMKVTFKKLQQLYEQKCELGISISDIDIEGLRIDNRHLEETIDQKNSHLVELKHINGKASLELATTKKMLLNLDTCNHILKKKIKGRERDKTLFANEAIATAKDLNLVKQNYDRVKHIIDNCKAPETLTYLKAKHQYSVLAKQHKVLCRQVRVVEITLHTYELNMLRMTRKKTVDNKWYLPLSADDDFDEPTEPIEPQNEDINSEFDIFKAINVKSLDSRTSHIK